MVSQNITVPTRGEPIDLAFMTTLAEYISDINNELLASKNALSSLYTVTGRTSLDTDDVAIWTGITTPERIATATAPTSRSWAVNYSAEVGFMAAPIVTATAVVTPGNTVGISCWVTKTTIGGTSGYFRFSGNTTQQETVTIHVTAIGPGRVR
jgi:hypothetical protein